MRPLLLSLSCLLFLVARGAGQGVIVKKDFRPLPFASSLGLNGICKFEIEGADHKVRQQLVTLEVFNRYQVGEQFDPRGKPRAAVVENAARPTPVPAVAAKPPAKEEREPVAAAKPPPPIPKPQPRMGDVPPPRDVEAERPETAAKPPEPVAAKAEPSAAPEPVRAEAKPKPPAPTKAPSPARSTAKGKEPERRKIGKTPDTQAETEGF